jgi:hypothetical protein
MSSVADLSPFVSRNWRALSNLREHAPQSLLERDQRLPAEQLPGAELKDSRNPANGLADISPMA